jgi:hypothetical protein
MGLLDARVLQIDGYMAEVELQWLQDTALKVPEGELIVEIGAWKGRSTSVLYMAAGSKNPVVTIDHWQGAPGDTTADIARDEDIFQTYLENMRELGITVSEFPGYENLAPGCFYLTGDSLQAASLFPEQCIAFFFDDGWHNRCGQQLDCFLPKIRDVAIVSGHDFFGWEVQSEVCNRMKVNQIVHSIWVSYKNGVEKVWYKW